LRYPWELNLSVVFEDSIENIFKTEYDIRKIFMLVPRTPVNNHLSRNSNSNTSNIETQSRFMMHNHPLKILRKHCDLATRKILFEKPENILPFQISYPLDYPEEIIKNNMQKVQIRLNWVRNSLTKNGLGELKANAVVSVND